MNTAPAVPEQLASLPPQGVAEGGLERFVVARSVRAEKHQIKVCSAAAKIEMEVHEPPGGFQLPFIPVGNTDQGQVPGDTETPERFRPAGRCGDRGKAQPGQEGIGCLQVLCAQTQYRRRSGRQVRRPGLVQHPPGGGQSFRGAVGQSQGKTKLPALPGG